MRARQLLRITAAARRLRVLALRSASLRRCWKPRPSSGRLARSARAGLGHGRWSARRVAPRWRVRRSARSSRPPWSAPSAASPSRDRWSLLAALAVPPFVAGLHRGGLGRGSRARRPARRRRRPRASSPRRPHRRRRRSDVFTWTVAGLGLGLIGAFLRSDPAAEPRPAGALPRRPAADPRADRPLRRARAPASTSTPWAARSSAPCTTSSRRPRWRSTSPAARR